MNPTQAEVKDMEKDLDPNETGSFDQMNLISLIARRPKTDQTLEQMIEALKVLNQDGNDEKDKVKLEVQNFRYYMVTNGEKLADHEIDDILLDCQDLVHEDFILIDDLANYLMTR